MSWSTIVLIVFFSSRISPFTSTVIFLERSPEATAVVTSAMLRTWPVRLVAIALTLSVRSFQVPATPFTLAWPPNLPSVPTSRATRVTSEANEASCSTMVLTTLPMRRNSPRSARPSISTAIDWREVAFRDRADHRATSAVGWTMSSISSLTERIAEFPAAGRRLDAAALADLAFLADDLRQPLELLRHLLVEADGFVEQAGDLAVVAGQVLGQADGEIAAPETAQGAEQLAAIEEIARGLDVHSLTLLRASPPPEFMLMGPRPRAPHSK